MVKRKAVSEIVRSKSEASAFLMGYNTQLLFVLGTLVLGLSVNSI